MASTVTARSVSIVIPTVGRPTLERALASIRSQDESPDRAEIIVVGDTHGGTWEPELIGVPAICERYRALYFEHDGGSHCWGQHQRNFGMRLASGDLISFLQDDDVYAVGALDTIRRHASGIIPTLFKCYLHHAGRAVWEQEGLIEMGNVDANCIVVPNEPDELGTWRPRYLGDLDFIKETVLSFECVLWDEHIIAEARPR